PTDDYITEKSWTDWPPQPIGAPKLVRPQISSLPESPGAPQLLAQTAATTPLPQSLSSVSSDIEIAATLDELQQQTHLSAEEWRHYWGGQLQSRSFRVRLHAINNLAKQGGPEVREILQRHLPHEADPKIAHQIRKHLNLVGR
ncbi:MAG: hypothetical protein AAFX06_27370, partial [Planctomycetota bacterium]